MKAILMSIQPEWCEQIANEKKTIILSKTRPKLETPFKGYIYCTDKRPKDNCWQFKPNLYIEKKTRNLKWIDTAFNSIYGYEWAQQKVIGEFVCNKKSIYLYGKNGIQDNEYWIIGRELEQVRLNYDELKDYGKGKTLYGLHISDLKIYDKPKELGEFYKSLPKKVLEEGNYDCRKGWNVLCVDAPEGSEYCAVCPYGGRIQITRPPQSWCYVEELEE